MFDPAFRVRIVFRPKSDKFVQVMRPEDRPISRKVVEIVHNNGDEKIYDLEWFNFKCYKSLPN